MGGAAAPQDPARLKAQGNEAFKAFKLDEAIELYSAAIAAAPNEPVYRGNRSAALFEAGRYAESLEDTEAAIAGNPDAALAAKLAIRAAKSALWLNETKVAQRWLAHGALADMQESKQVADVAALLRAMHATEGAPCRQAAGAARSGYRHR
jgi:tetratricopeptide (TPR) repeat protein